MKSTTFHRGAIAAGIAVFIAGCSGDGSTSEKAGGDAEPVSLRLGAVENSTVPYADEIEEFANATEALSEGSIDVEIVWDAAGGFTGESEHELAAMLGRGEIDLAVVPSRSWDELGVSSFDALQAPFLVDDLVLLGEIAGSDIAASMLEGLAPAGVEGLGIWPESLRHPVSFAEPLLTTADFRGAKLRVQNSKIPRAVAQAIGVEPVDPPDWPAAVAAGEMQGADSAFVWADGLPMYGIFTANITYYPKANVIAANAAVFDALSDENKDVLRRAATDTLAYVVDTNTNEADLAAQYCADGGRVVVAEAAVLTELAKLVEPVYAELATVADTAGYIDDIRALKTGQGSNADVVACGSIDNGSATADPQAVPAGEFPEGVYRAESGPDGVVTFEFRDRTWRRYFADGQLDCMATYVVTSGRIHVTSSTDSQYACGTVPGSDVLDATWTLDGDRLRFLDINSDPGAIADWSRPWTKIE